MRSHLQSIPRMHRGSRRNPFQTRCVVSPARVFLVRIVAHAETTFRLGTCFFLDRIMNHAETSFRLATRSLLASFPRSHRGSRRDVSKIGYVVSPAEISSAASWLTHKRLSEWLRRPTCRSFPRSHRGSRRNDSQIGDVVSPAEIYSTASWLTHKRLSDWLRRPPAEFSSIASVITITQKRRSD